MPSYVAFLRAINLAGKRKVPMADLRDGLSEAGFADVATYLQTGNVRVVSGMRAATKVAEVMEGLLAERYGFAIPCIVLPSKELRQVYDDALALPPPAYATDDHSHRFVILYKHAPSAQVVTEIASYTHDLEQACVVGRAAHVWISGNMSDSQIFKVLAKSFDPGTNRTLKVVRTVVDRWC